MCVCVCVCMCVWCQILVRSFVSGGRSLFCFNRTTVIVLKLLCFSAGLPEMDQTWRKMCKSKGSHCIILIRSHFTCTVQYNIIYKIYISFFFNWVVWSRVTHPGLAHHSWSISIPAQHNCDWQDQCPVHSELFSDPGFTDFARYRYSRKSLRS